MLEFSRAIKNVLEKILTSKKCSQKYVCLEKNITKTYNKMKTGVTKGQFLIV